MCFLLFLEPSRCSPHAGVSRFLQPSRHLSWSCTSNLCKLLAIMSHSSTSFHLFFGLPFFVPTTSKCSSFTGLLSSFILSTCPNHRNLCSFRNSSQSLYTRHFTNLLIVYFIFQGFPTYHSQHLHFL